MTITQAHRLFRLSLDKMDGLNYPNFRSEEIDVILNQAYNRWVKQRYSRSNPKNTGVEENQKRMDDLKNLIKESRNYVAQNLKKDKYTGMPLWSVSLASDYWFMLYE